MFFGTDKGKPLHIDEARVRDVLRIEQVIEALRHAFWRRHSAM